MNGKPTTTDTPLRTPKSLNANPPTDAEASAWGANFWVTLADPAVSVTYLFAMLLVVIIALFMADRCFVLRVPSNWRSKLGPTSRKLPVSQPMRV